MTWGQMQPVDEWKRKAGKRALVYQALKDAGDKGVSRTDLGQTVELAGMHLSSLIAEGHSIQAILLAVDRGQPVEGWRLVKDAWDNEQEAPT
jgi:hypothetical protein